MVQIGVTMMPGCTEFTRILSPAIAHSIIAMIKVAVPNMACQVVDWSVQAHGGGGTSNDFGLTHVYAMARVLRLADGPDEVHNNQIGKLELKKYR